MKDNPYERYDIDPREGAEAITRRMRELIEQADEDERAELRAMWELLTLHPRTRLHAALDAFPETRPKLGDPPSEKRSDDADWPQHDWSVLELADIVLLPSVLAALRGEATESAAAPSFAVLPPLDEDPILDDPK